MESETEGRIIKIGQHRVRHGNIYEQDGIASLVGFDKADIFYSDPPWGEGNLKYWDTINKKMNPNAKEYDFGFNLDRFLDVILTSVVKYTNGFAVIEYGKRWSDLLIPLAQAKGLHYCGQVETLYKGGGKKLPLDILVFHTAGVKQIDLSPVYHTMGYTTTKTIFDVLKPKAYGVGMDLCCGMGYTAQACIDNGMRFIGNELNSKRLEKTIKRLMRAEHI